MQFSKRTFKIHPNCLWNFYGKKKQNKKKATRWSKEVSVKEIDWDISSSAQLIQRLKGILCHSATTILSVVLWCCHWAACQQPNSVYIHHVYITPFFLIDHGSALQDHETLYLLSFRREEEIRQQISGSVQDIEELSVCWMSGAWPDRKNIL